MDQQTQKELLRIVKLNYNEIADHYHETRKKQLARSWEALLEITKVVPTGARVLDVGCGNGRLLDAFKAKPVKYLGIDQNEKLIKHARERHPTQRFTVGDIVKLGEVPDYGFDYVFSIALFHHLPGKKLRIDALKQLKNKVKLGGKIVITVWNMWSEKWEKKDFKKTIYKYAFLKFIKKNRMDLGDILLDWKNSSGDVVSQRYYHAFTKRELRKIAKKAGLKILEVKKDEFNYYLVLTK